MKKHSYRFLSFAAVAAAALAPALAAAQTGPSYVVSGPIVTPYVPLASCTAVSVSDQSGQAVNLPFDIPFFGKPESTLGISMNGYATFGNTLGQDGNTAIPHNSTSSPTKVMAVWWDDLNNTTGSKVCYQFSGTAPNRVVKVEWKDVVRYGTTNKISFQLELSESSGRIRMYYGSTTPGNPSASVGVQGEAGQGVSGLPSCTTTSSGNCGVNDFPVNKMIEYRPPADLTIPAYVPDETVYANVPFTATITLTNAGGTDANNVVARQYLSTDAVLDGSDQVLGDTMPVNLASGATQAVVVTSTLPSVSQGTYFLIAEVDPQNTVFENIETNNLAAPAMVTVGQPMPDLTVDSVTAPATADVGAMLAVNGEVRNRGNVDMEAATPVTFFLSDNPVVTTSDKVLGEVELSAPLAAGATQAISGSFTVPTSLPGGKYWIGACADTDATLSASGSLEEIDETNNCAVGSSFLVNAGALEVVTSVLMDATENAPYGERLEAVGGVGQYTWSQSSGELPGGITLTTTGGLEGSPSQAGTFTFEAQVTSGTGSAATTATRSFTLNVQKKDLPLNVVSQTLSAAEFGRGYEEPLVAKGGVPPYRWALAAGSKLPRGLAISSDGYLAGRPFEIASQTNFDVVVTDKAKNTATSTLQVTVVAPSTLRVATAALPKATLGKGYRQELKAVGGSGQYTFHEVSFQRLAQSYGEAAGEVQATIPPEIGLAVENNELKGMPKKAGLYAITFHVTDDMYTEVEDVTTLPLLVTYEEGLQVVTTRLPEARVGDSYLVKLTSNAKEGVAVKFVEPCLQQPKAGADGVGFTCTRDPAQSLPPGLVMAEDGTISGTPEALADGAETKVFDFLVLVSDDAGRSDLRSLSLKVRTPPPPKEGCTAVGGEALPLLGGALVLLGGLRRRKKK